MNQSLIKLISPFKSWFVVDTRILGIFRFFLGILAFSDILRRWSTRDIFYSSIGLYPSTSSSATYKSFSLLHTFNSSWEIDLFFIVGFLFSIFLMLGYKTKLSHLITVIIVISLHNRVVLIENAGDFVMNCMLVWTLFLPLGKSISLDSLRYSLKNINEYDTGDLNNRTQYSYDLSKYYSIAYFAVLFQISAIYFFTGINKNGADWMSGTAVHYFYQLDTFLTPLGAFVRNYIGVTFSKLATYTTLLLELSVPVLLLFPLYSLYFRLLAIIVLTFFHLTIGASLSIGLFSQTMIVSFILLLDGRIVDWIKSYVLKKNNKKYILFYDSDCGFCHYTARVIKRLDIFHRIKFANQNYSEEKKPDNFEKLTTQTAIIFDPETMKSWTRHEAFAKIFSLIPCGFFLSWIFYIPGLNLLFGWLYDRISNNRTLISNFFGLPVCGIKNITEKKHLVKIALPKYKIFLKRIKYVSTSTIVVILLLASINYNLVANESVNEYMGKFGFEKFKYNRSFKKIMSYPRIIQRWNMFSPSVLKRDKWLIVEATLSDGTIIDPFTGKDPILDSVDYEVLWKDINQFWRKYFTRILKNKKHIENFERWLIRKNNYFNDTIGDRRITSVKLWSLSQRNSAINSDKEYKVIKNLLNDKQKKKSKKSKNKKRSN